ncbi:aminopeptidase N [Kordiimonas sp. SCSIO 12603]|nr:aminopeptidase N [Kordiimonas sp. SCSIO 12603]
MDASLVSPASKKEIFLKDYSAPTFSIEKISLLFELFEDSAIVTAKSVFRKTIPSETTLTLDGGQYMELLTIELDGRQLSPNEYTLTDTSLVIHGLPEVFELTVKTKLKPKENTRLDGLYYSGGNFCTQCEAEGFRHITYFLDRPDVLASYDVRIEADKARYPVLLANGNRSENGDLENGRHFAEWHDPHPKPSYLFALVAGDLAERKSSFVTKSGNEIELNIYVRPEDMERSEYAMGALQRSMKWDEDVYGLEYDLNIYNIVAVSDFNMGAMENKGLNIFNTKYVLADQYTATDADFGHVEGVIGHEYFHNWTGNRVTCRDWFQLSLKEGLTVFRDQEFSADLGSRSLKRIEDVKALRFSQFPEDGSPLAHPVRPEKYVEINNFYTATVYNKGAEVIRMMHTLIGASAFRDGMDLYFERHDGQAVTCEDFVKAMESASGMDLRQFRLWYSQAGTPTVSFERRRKGNDVSLRLEQACPATPGQATKKANHMPIVIGWLDASGKEITPAIEGSGNWNGTSCLLQLTETMQEFVFRDVPEGAVLSFLRGFSAPVLVKSDYSESELAHLIKCDTDAFARYEAAQTLATDVLIAAYEGVDSTSRAVYLEAISGCLSADQQDDALLAELVSIPSELEVGQKISELDVERLHIVREALLREVAEQNMKQLLGIYQSLKQSDYELSEQAKGKRRLRNRMLSYLSLLDGGDQIVKTHYHDANNMTDQIAALIEVSHGDFDYRQEIFDDFYKQWHENELVIDKWFAVQAQSKRSDTLSLVEELSNHDDFSYTNPNRLRSLVMSFSLLNQRGFHAADGSGYKFLANVIAEVDKKNPQTAAKLVAPLGRWQKQPQNNAALMKKYLNTLLETSTLSDDVRELCEKSVA